MLFYSLSFIAFIFIFSYLLEVYLFLSFLHPSHCKKKICLRIQMPPASSSSFSFWPFLWFPRVSLLSQNSRLSLYKIFIIHPHISKGIWDYAYCHKVKRLMKITLSWVYHYLVHSKKKYPTLACGIFMSNDYITIKDAANKVTTTCKQHNLKWVLSLSSQIKLSSLSITSFS